MANAKISELTAVTTPASTDQFAVNQGGVTKRETRAQIHTLQSGETLDASAGTSKFGSIDSHALFKTDATYDIGASGATRPRDIYLSRDIAAGGRGNVSDGTAGNTALRFATDANTGIIRVTTDQLGLVAGGVVGITLAETIATLLVQLRLPATTTSLASLRVPHGTAPTSPVNGDIWSTTAGLYVRINGGTVGPLIQ